LPREANRCTADPVKVLNLDLSWRLPVATSQHAFKPGSCPVRTRLIAELLQAHTDIAAIHNLELDALLRGDFEADAQLIRKLADARIRRDAVVQELREHVAEHGC